MQTNLAHYVALNIPQNASKLTEPKQLNFRIESRMYGLVGYETLIVLFLVSLSLYQQQLERNYSGLVKYAINRFRS